MVSQRKFRQLSPLSLQKKEKQPIYQGKKITTQRQDTQSVPAVHRVVQLGRLAKPNCYMLVGIPYSNGSFTLLDWQHL